MNVLIEYDDDTEMLSITNTIDDECVFYGNYWDFNRGPENFRQLFERLGLEVELKKRLFE